MFDYVKPAITRQMLILVIGLMLIGYAIHYFSRMSIECSMVGEGHCVCSGMNAVDGPSVLAKCDVTPSTEDEKGMKGAIDGA
jgi:hypothetical protein